MATTTAAVLAILLALTPLLVQWVKRRWKAKDDPDYERKQKQEANDRIIAGGKESIDDLNVALADKLARVQDKTRRAPKRSGSELP